MATRITFFIFLFLLNANYASVLTFIKKKLKHNEHALHNLEEKPDIFPLSHLPREIQNEIAAHLIAKEDDSEFVFNTKESNQGGYYKKFLDDSSVRGLKIFDSKYFHVQVLERYGEVYLWITRKNDSFSSKFWCKNGVFFSYSPNFSKIILIFLVDNYSFKIRIFDGVAGEQIFKQSNKVYRCKNILDDMYPGFRVAVSNDGKFFAIARSAFNHDPVGRRGLSMADKIFLAKFGSRSWLITVYDNLWGLVKDFKVTKFPDDIISLSFNNNGTKIIAHSQTNHEIFELQKDIKHATNNLLADYFKQAGVCSKWPQA